MAVLDQIAALIRTKALDEHLSLADATREWCRATSVHANGAWWQAHANDGYYVLEQMYKTAIGDPGAETVELLCGNMVDIMSAIYSTLGIQSRAVWLYRNNDDFFGGHTFLEVLNPGTGKWEIQDGDYNVYYVNVRTGERASALDMMYAPDVELFVPVNQQATGWTATDAEALRLVSYFATEIQTTTHTLYVNVDSADQSTLDAIATELGNANWSYTTTLINSFPGYNHLVDDDAVIQGGRKYLIGGSGMDFLSYDGSTAAVLNGGAGDDVIATKWGAAQIYGGAGNDILVGGVGNDLLVGGAGNDDLTGGWGADVFLFSFDSGMYDRLDGFGDGADTITFQNAYGYNLPRTGNYTISANEFAARVSQIVTTDGVWVSYDLNADHKTDGRFFLEGRTTLLTTANAMWIFSGPLTEANAIAWNGSKLVAGTSSYDTILYNGTEVATLAGSLTGSNSGNDYIYSTASVHTNIYGHDGIDILISGSASDFIVGGTGNDIMTGGGGTDCFVFSNGDGCSDVITDFQAGTDMLLMLGITGLGGSGAGYQTVSGTEFGFRVIQSLGSQGLTLQYDFNGDGRMDGSTLLRGLSSTIEADDIVWSYNANAQAGIVTTSQPTGSGPYTQQIMGTAAADKIVYSGTEPAVLAGYAGDDQIQARTAANTAIYGNDGNDTLVGGSGADFIEGGRGNDYMRGAAGTDAFAFKAGAGFADAIADFQTGADHLVFVGVSGDGFSANGTYQTLTDAAFDARVQQQWASTGELDYRYDLNGDGTMDGAILLSGMTSFLHTSNAFWI
jgi:Ca2+-binding RTX toxin-like protein